LSFLHPKRVRFKCERCAFCCGDTKYKVRRILLLKIEAEYISKKTFMSIDEFARKIDGFEPYTHIMKKTEDSNCIFLKDKTCSIYQIRPLVCRFYPFQLQNLEDNRYVFTYTDECPGIGKGPYLKKRFFEKMFRNFTESMREDRETKNGDSA